MVLCSSIPHALIKLCVQNLDVRVRVTGVWHVHTEYSISLPTNAYIQDAKSLRYWLELMPPVSCIFHESLHSHTNNVLLPLKNARDLLLAKSPPKL